MMRSPGLPRPRATLLAMTTGLSGVPGNDIVIELDDTAYSD
jgi:hypothetical protein